MKLLPETAAACGLALALACSASTKLAPLDKALLVNAERAAGAIVTRQDGGMPSADRGLAGTACDDVVKVVEHAKQDSGFVCPPR